jgi:hypothetical protein
MTSKSATSTITLVANHHPHCQHRTAGGRRCRLAVAPNSNSYCYRHLPSSESTHPQSADLAPNVTDTADHFAYLSQQYEHFQTAQGINQALANLYELLSRNLISPRRASILAYISSLLLRTLPQIDADNAAGIEFNPKTQTVDSAISAESSAADSESEEDPTITSHDVAVTADSNSTSTDTWDPSLPEPDPTKKPS